MQSLCSCKHLKDLVDSLVAFNRFLWSSSYVWRGQMGAYHRRCIVWLRAELELCFHKLCFSSQRQYRFLLVFFALLCSLFKEFFHSWILSWKQREVDRNIMECAAPRLIAKRLPSSSSLSDVIKAVGERDDATDLCSLPLSDVFFSN